MNSQYQLSFGPNQGNSKQMKQLICNQHQKTIGFVCVDQNCVNKGLCCEDCLSISHNNHRIFGLEQFVDLYKTSIQTQNSVQSLQSSLEYLNGLQKQIMQAIEVFKDQLSETLLQTQQNLQPIYQKDLKLVDNNVKAEQQLVKMLDKIQSQQISSQQDLQFMVQQLLLRGSFNPQNNLFQINNLGTQNVQKIDKIIKKQSDLKSNFADTSQKFLRDIRKYFEIVVQQIKNTSDKHQPQINENYMIYSNNQPIISTSGVHHIPPQQYQPKNNRLSKEYIDYSIEKPQNNGNNSGGYQKIGGGNNFSENKYHLPNPVEEFKLESNSSSNHFKNGNQQDNYKQKKGGGGDDYIKEKNFNDASYEKLPKFQPSTPQQLYSDEQQPNDQNKNDTSYNNINEGIADEFDGEKRQQQPFNSQVQELFKNKPKKGSGRKNIFDSEKVNEAVMQSYNNSKDFHNQEERDLLGKIGDRSPLAKSPFRTQATPDRMIRKNYFEVQGDQQSDNDPNSNPRSRMHRRASNLRSASRSPHISPRNTNRSIRSMSNEVQKVQTKNRTSYQAHNAQVNGFVFVDNDKIATVSGDALLKMYDKTDGKLIMNLEGHDSEINCIDYEQNSRIIATGSSDNSTIVWRPVPQWEQVSLLKDNGPVQCVNFFSAQILLTGSNSSLKIWNIEAEEEIQYNPIRNIEVQGLPSCMLLHQNNQCLLMGVGKSIQVYDTNKYLCLKQLNNHTGKVTQIIHVKRKNDGQMIASCSRDGTVKLWEGKSMVLMKTIIQEEKPIYSIAYIYKKDTLICGLTSQNPLQQEGKITFWDMETFKKTKEIEENKTSVTQITYDFVNNLLFSSHQNGCIEYHTVWED